MSSIFSFFFFIFAVFSSSFLLLLFRLLLFSFNIFVFFVYFLVSSFPLQSYSSFSSCLIPRSFFYFYFCFFSSVLFFFFIFFVFSYLFFFSFALPHWLGKNRRDGAADISMDSLCTSGLLSGHRPTEHLLDYLFLDYPVFCSCASLPVIGCSAWHLFTVCLHQELNPLALVFCAKERDRQTDRQRVREREREREGGLLIVSERGKFERAKRVQFCSCCRCHFLLTFHSHFSLFSFLSFILCSFTFKLFWCVCVCVVWVRFFFLLFLAFLRGVLFCFVFCTFVSLPLNSIKQP